MNLEINGLNVMLDDKPTLHVLYYMYNIFSHLQFTPIVLMRMWVWDLIYFSLMLQLKETEPITLCIIQNPFPFHIPLINIRNQHDEDEMSLHPHIFLKCRLQCSSDLRGACLINIIWIWKFSCAYHWPERWPIGVGVGHQVSHVDSWRMGNAFQGFCCKGKRKQETWLNKRDGQLEHDKISMQREWVAWLI